MRLNLEGGPQARRNLPDVIGFLDLVAGGSKQHAMRTTAFATCI